MNQVKLMNMLGLALRAGKLITGEEMTITAIRKQKVDLVIVAQDASDNTKKKVRDKSAYYQIPNFEALSKEEITQALGRPRTVLGIADPGFAKKIAGLIKG